MKSRGVKIVCKANGVRRRNDVDVFDLETGEKLTDICEVDLGITREAQTVRITSSADWVYEGPADFVPPEEMDIDQGVANINASLQGLDEEQETA